MAKPKPEVIDTSLGQIKRIWVKTHVLNKGDDLIAEVKRYTSDILQPQDILTIAESPVAAVQGRAIPITEIKPGFWAKILWRFVKKVPYGIGLRSPWSMQCAIDEVGLPRILRAAVAGFWGKIGGKSGEFYRVAGKEVAMIDAAHTSGVKEFYECVILGPKDPDGVARQIAQALGCPVAVVDANDIFGCTVVGASDGLNIKLVEEAMRDNPAGQGDQLTPIIILRPDKSKTCC
ncbi:MAG: coenzyme F420-0:L-glutamate ligase [candidate division WOR-3 bacterium]